MAKQETRSKPDEVLRARAKKFLAKPGPELDKIPPTEIQKLVHELQIHQVELDMQNEELRRSQGETEAALAKYSDLYDSAPIGYFTFNPQGIILEANLTGARLLGMERGSLLGTPFLSHVVPAFRPEFRAHLRQVFTTQARPILHLAVSHLRGRRPVCDAGEHCGPDDGQGVPPNAALPSATARPANSPKKTCAAVRKNSICSLIRLLWGTSPWTRRGTSLR